MVLREQDDQLDFWDDLSDEEKAGIDRGLEDVEAGRVYTHEEVMKGVKEKFNIDLR